jgi:hypothetical protein
MFVRRGNKYTQYTGLKARAEENNHQGDGRSAQDKYLKSLQQRLLNMLRMLATLHPFISQKGNKDYEVLSQQLFYYVAETELEVLRERKRRSIPGAVAESTNVLFTSTDLTVDRTVQNINGAGGALLFENNSMPYFPTPTGFKHWRRKGLGYRSMGTGKSYGSSYGPWRAKGTKGTGRGFKGRGKPSLCPARLSQAYCRQISLGNRVGRQMASAH